MKSEHDHWGELRALRKRLRRADRAGDKQARVTLWERYRELSLSLEAMIARLYGGRCPECGGMLESGYGFAFGALGAYQYCVADNECCWHLLTPDTEGL